MKFYQVAEVFDQLEAESSRLKITYMLADLFKLCSAQEAAVVAYLSIGSLNPPYGNNQYNFAEKGMRKVIARLIDKPQEEIKALRSEYGDYGLLVANEYKGRVNNKLSLLEVSKALHELLDISGSGSQEKKEKHLFGLLTLLDPLSAKYVVRTIIGKLRLGFSDMTLIDAFSWMQEGDKSLRPQLEGAYNVSVDIGLVIKTLKEEGVEGIAAMSIQPGIPIRPAAAERLANAAAIVEKLGPCLAQPKLDGFRLQVHLFKSEHGLEVRFFSRNLLDMSGMFPELRDAVKDLDVESFVAEGEAIAYDSDSGSFLPFQETVKRKRKHDIKQVAQDFPLKLYLFDLLYLNGKSLLNDSHAERRTVLEQLLSHKKVQEAETVLCVEEKKIATAQQLEHYFNENISIGLEGLVVKRPDAAYQPGKRNFVWIKLKRQETGSLDDTVDCVILGYYFGHGKRVSFGIGALLVGVYNDEHDRFETIAKIGTGLKDEGWKEIKKACDEYKVDSKPNNVDCAKELYPDVWVKPTLVCMIRADEITRSPLHKAGLTKENLGLALRFPRIMGMRSDKDAHHATTVTEIEKMFSLQFHKKKKVSKKEVQKTLFE